jgi:pyruvate,water dikinase
MKAVHIDDIEARDPALVGHKAANLARLRMLDVRVPEAWVLTGDISIDDDVEKSMLQAQVEKVLADLGHGPVAVRSSGIREDLAGASFAGMYETVLDLR